MDSGEAQPSGLTAFLIASGDRDKQALDQLLPSVYDELRRLAAYEAYLRLVGQR